MGGHSIYQFLKKLPEGFEISKSLINTTKNLDKHYITSRYPNGFASGTPEDYYVKEDAEEAISDGERILKFCEDQISFLREETDYIIKRER